jgi:hypothetical protein
MRQFLLVVALVYSFTGNAQATIYYQTSFENETCNTNITDAVTAVDGRYWDIYDPPAPAVRCTLTPPAGSKYVEWNDSANLNNNQSDVFNINHTVVPGSTYYLAGYFRFERIASNDIWQDVPGEPRIITCGRASPTDPADSFDKLLEMNGPGFRWGISSGWPGGLYPGSHDHQFTFDAWCASSVVTQCDAEGTYDHKSPNANGYTVNNPYLASYDTWYAVVLGITAGTTSGTGRIQLWVNGTKIQDRTHTTMNSSATINTIIANGTLAQPCYDSPAHKRQIDRMLLTNTWQDVLDGGYMSWGGGGDTTAPSPPSGLSVN